MLHSDGQHADESGLSTATQAADFLKTARPQVADKLPQRNPDAMPIEHMARIDTSNAKNILGMEKFFDWQTTLLDCVDDLLNVHAKNWQ